MARLWPGNGKSKSRRWYTLGLQIYDNDDFFIVGNVFKEEARYRTAATERFLYLLIGKIDFMGKPLKKQQ